jgi:ureidoacrylate peracid hydrolase
MNSLDELRSRRIQEILKPGGLGLLIVDLQNDFIAPKGKNAGWDKDTADMQKIVPNIQKVIDLFRTLKRPIIWTEDAEDPESRTTAGLDRYLWLEQNDKRHVACIKGTWGAEFYLPPQEGDIIIKKTRISAYINTNLAKVVQDNGIKTMLVVGVKTQRCVAATARDLYENESDLHVILLEDCVASDDPAQHLSTVAEFKQFWPPVLTSKTILDALN